MTIPSKLEQVVGSRWRPFVRSISKSIAGFLLGIALAAGLWGRLHGFGGRPLAIDEYFFVSGARLILNHGVPLFEDGGYYLQGLIPQYATALSIAVFGESGVSCRLPALLAGLLAPLLAYRYSRNHLPAVGAAAITAALLVSAWEVEFSRFARMYAALQCATLAFLIRFDRSIVGPEWEKRYRIHGWAIVAVLTHFLGVLLVPLLFVPLLDWKDREKRHSRRDLLRYSAVTLVVALSIVLFATGGYWSWGVSDPYPPNYTPPEFSYLRTPAFPLWSISADPHANLAFILAGLGLAFVCAVGFHYRRGRVSGPDIGLPLVLVSAALHQFVFAALASFVLTVRCGFYESFWANRQHRAFSIAVAAASLGWAIAAVVYRSTIEAVDGAGSWAGGVRRAFLEWPDFYKGLWQPWSEVLPLITVLTILAVAYLLSQKARQPWRQWFVGPAAVVSLGILGLGFLQFKYVATRYAFNFYPIALVAIALALTQFAGPKRGAALFLLLFGLSGDFHVKQLAHPMAPEIVQRLGDYERFGEHWYPHPDYQRMVERLTQAKRKNPSAVLILACCRVASFDLDVEHTVYLPRDSHHFFVESRQRGTVHLWSRQRLLSTPEEVRDYTAGTTEVWLVRHRVMPYAFLDPDAVWGDRVLGVQREYPTADQQVEILQVKLK